MGSSVKAHQHTNVQPCIRTCMWTNSHVCTDAVSIKNGRHTFAPVSAEINSQGGSGTFFLSCSTYIYFLILLALLDTLLGAAVVFILITEDGIGQGPIKNIFDSMITWLLTNESDNVYGINKWNRFSFSHLQAPPVCFFIFPVIFFIVPVFSFNLIEFIDYNIQIIYCHYQIQQNVCI